MPELPEVETVKRTLSGLVIGKTIRCVEVKLTRIIREPEDPNLFAALLEGQTIQDIDRRGKFLLFILDDFVLVSHLRMEGRFGVYQDADPVEKHTHVIFSFTDHTQMRYKDVRQFGTMDLFHKGEELLKPPLNKLGLEPLDESFTFEAFNQTLNNRTTRIKPLLLNQAYIVGIGNIYVDETLFLAGIHPERTANSLTHNELKRLYDSILQTLHEAVAVGGSSIKSFVNGQGEIGMFQHQFKVYGRTQEPCVNCGQPIQKMIVGGRGTHICPKCQPINRK